MKWIKRGRIFEPTGSQWWSRQYGIVPTPRILDERTLRIYFATADEHSNGRVTYVDVDSSDPSNIRGDAQEPVLDIGAPGTFDDSGVAPSCVIDHDGRTLMYYCGFQRADRVPYMLFTGLAISHDGGDTFERHSQVPILDRTRASPISVSAPFVLHSNGLFHMWNWFGLRWIEVNGKLYIESNIGYAESHDGIHWRAADRPVIGLRADEFGIGRPWVVVENGLHRMWYSVRGHSTPYRIGYAESSDGIDWIRKDDEVGIDVSASGWDAQMVCYPAVIKAAGKTYLFYNGNDNGKTGFGFAESLG